MLIRKACFLVDERGIRIYYPAIYSEHHFDIARARRWKEYHKKRSYRNESDDRVATTERIKPKTKQRR